MSYHKNISFQEAVKVKKRSLSVWFSMPNDKKLSGALGFLLTFNSFFLEKPCVYDESSNCTNEINEITGKEAKYSGIPKYVTIHD